MWIILGINGSFAVYWNGISWTVRKVEAQRFSIQNDAMLEAHSLSMQQRCAMVKHIHVEKE